MSNVFSGVCTVARDAEVRYTPSGTAILTVTVANNVGFGDKQKTNWIRVTLFGKRAEGQLQTFLTKGQQVFISGELSVNEYEAKDGTTKQNLEVNATVVDLIGKREQKPSQEKPKPAKQESFDDDIPF